MCSDTIHSTRLLFLIKTPFLQQTICRWLYRQNLLKTPIQQFNVITCAIKNTQTACSYFVDVIVTDIGSWIGPYDQTLPVQLEKDNHVKTWNNEGKFVQRWKVHCVNVKSNWMLMNVGEIRWRFALQQL